MTYYVVSVFLNGDFFATIKDNGGFDSLMFQTLPACEAYLKHLVENVMDPKYTAGCYKRIK
jgi:hypothetical protein